ncbi:MAG: hypothetical protein BGN97_00085 [Microbacterium sp. 69-10]|uniref:hypothetical protein n=1 Tax=Microbacterium sp. 69-10 TaxID=1895783 RepID=UPI00096569D4|nr:hypothetical protein [Microbacterium sp. 69-10]OJU39658.1 MAG: hypothetical protein BGN97_00085 [Microbacterium sp. 69-10]
MNTLAIQFAVASVMVPVGIAGAVIAALSAVITCVVLIRGSDEIGIPIAGWIVGTILSLAAAFVELTPTVVAAAAGAVLVVVALVVLGGRRAHSRRLHTR